MSLGSLLFLLSLVTFTRSECNGKDNLLIQALIPQNNPTFATDTVIPAVHLAVDTINNGSLLRDFCLNATIADTKCDPAEGTWQMIKSVLDTIEPPRYVIFLGGGCSLATEPTAALSGAFYHVVQISFGASSPVLSERENYPLFFRTIPSETLPNSVRFALMNTYNWCKVATLHETANIFSLTVQDFHDRFKSLNISSCQNDTEEPFLFSFTGDPEIPLNQIVEKNIRIIFGFFYEDKALIVLCYAYHKQLTTKNHLWILPAWYADNWWKKADQQDFWTNYTYSCNSSVMEEAIRYSLLLDSYPIAEDQSAPTVAGISYNEFVDQYTTYLDAFLDSLSVPVPETMHPYSTFMYDAVWTIALALNKTEELLNSENETLADFEYSSSPTHDNDMSLKIQTFMNETDFAGVSGRVIFDSNGTRIGLSGLYQMRNSSVGGPLERVLIATHNYTKDGLNIDYTIDPLWKGDGPPTDRSIPIDKYLSPDLIYGMDVLVALGLAIALGVLVFNTVTIRTKLISNSAPLINTVIIVGCIVMMVACVLLGIDSGTPMITMDATDNATVVEEIVNQRYADICTARLWLLSFGFTLSFGALFAKTWQVYRVYTNPKLKDQPFKIWNFLILMAIQLTVDLVFLLIWTFVCPFERKTYEKFPDEDTVLNYEKCDCEYYPYFVGTLYVYKGLLVVFGLFLAYESRNVKYFFINDSRFVSIATYFVVIIIGISAPLSLVLAEQDFIDPAYGLSVSMIVFACTICMLVLYVPKFICMAKGKDTMIPAVKTEMFTPVDGLQLGQTDIGSEDILKADKQIKELKEKVKQKDLELEVLQLQARISDDDSGVHCGTTDETRVSFSVPPTPVVEEAAQVSSHLKDAEDSEEKPQADDGGESARAEADTDKETEIEEELDAQKVSDSHPTTV